MVSEGTLRAIWKNSNIISTLENEKERRKKSIAATFLGKDQQVFEIC